MSQPQPVGIGVGAHRRSTLWPRPVTRSMATMRVLQQRISAGAWAIGATIPSEPVLMAELGVARTTLREALSTLIHLGMLEANRGLGTVVRTQSMVSTVLAEFTGDYPNGEVRDLLTTLEARALRLTAVRRDPVSLARLAELVSSHPDDCSAGLPSLRDTLVEGCGDQLLIDMVRGLRTVVRGSAVDSPRHPCGVDHRPLVAAITAGDAELAARIAEADAARCRPG